MLDHIELKTQRMAECVAFYTAVLEPVGYRLVVDGEKKGFGHGEQLDFWLTAGEPARDVHFAFTAASRSAVDLAYERAGTHGSVRERPPALAPHIHPNYYAGFALDPEGRLVEFVSRTES